MVRTEPSGQTGEPLVIQEPGEAFDWGRVRWLKQCGVEAGMAKCGEEIARSLDVAGEAERCFLQKAPTRARQQELREQGAGATDQKPPFGLPGPHQILAEIAHRVRSPGIGLIGQKRPQGVGDPLIERTYIRSLRHPCVAEILGGHEPGATARA